MMTHPQVINGGHVLTLGASMCMIDWRLQVDGDSSLNERQDSARMLTSAWDAFQ